MKNLILLPLALPVAKSTKSLSATAIVISGLADVVPNTRDPNPSFKLRVQVETFPPVFLTSN